jgi:hypothetical protein
MGKIARIMSGGAVLAALATPALAQNSATATASGSATIIQPLTITKNNDLAFGAIVKPTTGTATVTINGSTGARTVTGTAAANATGVSRAVFTVSGEGAQHFSITVPSTFSMTSGANSLVVTTANPTGATGLLSGSIGSTGSLSLGVGGSFNLTSATASGAYTGTFTVTVAYD